MALEAGETFLIWLKMALFRLEASNFLGNSDAIPSKIPDFRTKNHSFLSQTGNSHQLHSVTLPVQNRKPGVSSKEYSVKNRILVLVCCAIFTQNLLKAQEGAEAGIGIAAVSYFGDLNTNLRLNRIGAAAGFGLRYNFNERLAIKLSGNIGRVEAYDSDSPNIYERARNLHFRSIVADAGGQIEFNFLPYYHGSKDNNWTPYLFAGLGVSYFNPKAELDGKWHELRPLGTEGQFKGDEYYTVAGGWVYGAGFKIDLSYEWSLNIDISARRLFSDYLDDVSGSYPDPDDVSDLRGEEALPFIDRSPELFAKDPDFFTRNNIEAPIGEPGRQRGNSKNNDTYVYLGIGIYYYFGDLKCPYEN